MLPRPFFLVADDSRRLRSKLESCGVSPWGLPKQSSAKTTVRLTFGRWDALLQLLEGQITAQKQPRLGSASQEPVALPKGKALLTNAAHAIDAQP